MTVSTSERSLARSSRQLITLMRWNQVHYTSQDCLQREDRRTVVADKSHITTDWKLLANK